MIDALSGIELDVTSKGKKGRLNLSLTGIYVICIVFILHLFT